MNVDVQNSGRICNKYIYFWVLTSLICVKSVVCTNVVCRAPCLWVFMCYHGIVFYLCLVILQFGFCSFVILNLQLELTHDFSFSQVYFGNAWNSRRALLSYNIYMLWFTLEFPTVDRLLGPTLFALSFSLGFVMITAMCFCLFCKYVNKTVNRLSTQLLPLVIKLVLCLS